MQVFEQAPEGMQPQYLECDNNRRLAYHKVEGKSEHSVLFLGGFRSDMDGSKARALHGFCEKHEINFVRFDYTGHGKSSGEFHEGCISDWLEDTLSIIDKVTTGPLLVVGSSMGGWLMLLAALQRPDRVVRLIGLAAAPDFTHDLMWELFTDDQQQELTTNGYISLPNDYDTPYIITQKLIDDGRKHILLDEGAGSVPINCPITLIQGMQDTSVPWQTSLRIAEAVSTPHVDIHFLKDGDHRLSTPDKLNMLCKVLDPKYQD